MRFPWSRHSPPPPPPLPPPPELMIDRTSTGGATLAVSVILTIVMAILCARAIAILSTLRKQAKPESRAIVVEDAPAPAPASPRPAQLKKTTPTITPTDPPTSSFAAIFARCLGQGLGEQRLAASR